MSKLKIAIICPLFDAAGVSYKLKEGLEKYYGDQCEVIHAITDQTHINPKYQYKVTNPDDAKKVKDFLKKANIIHFNNHFWDGSPCLKYQDFIQNKEQAIIYHSHGDLNLWFPDHIREYLLAGRAAFWTCNPQLQSLYPESKWVPNYFESNKLMQECPKIKKEDEFKLSFTCCHPFNKHILEVETILQAFTNHFKNKRYCVFPHKDFYGIAKGEKNLYEMYKWKRDFNITLDNISQGFIGMTAWESMALGHAVLGNISKASKKKYETFFENAPPIKQCDEINELAVNIRAYKYDPELLYNDRMKSLLWMKHNYNEKKIIKYVWQNYLKTYDEMI